LFGGVCKAHEESYHFCHANVIANEAALLRASKETGNCSSHAALRRGRLTWPELSMLARRDDLMAALWRDSASLLEMAA
jgi:hypothetical protein